MQNKKLKKLVFAAVIAAVYAAISLALAPISFGQIQLRASEALTILPVLNPVAIWGVTLGCLITNAVGVSMGANFLGAIDIVTGTAATLVAALLSARLGKYKWRGLPILSTIPPILINAIVIGGEWCYVTIGGLSIIPYLTFGGIIALGQFGACTLLGLLFYRALERTKASEYLKNL